jgi:hypothetical protein
MRGLLVCLAVLAVCLARPRETKVLFEWKQLTFEGLPSDLVYNLSNCALAGVKGKWPRLSSVSSDLSQCVSLFTLSFSSPVAARCSEESTT